MMELVIAILALVVVALAAGLVYVLAAQQRIIDRRLGQRDIEVSMDIAKIVIDSYNAGAQTRSDLMSAAVDQAQDSIRRRRERNNWNPDADTVPPARQEDKPIDTALYGNEAVIAGQ
jgi:hypothetical protein